MPTSTFLERAAVDVKFSDLVLVLACVLSLGFILVFLFQDIGTDTEAWSTVQEYIKTQAAAAV